MTSLALFLLLGACAPARLLRVENELLSQENTRLQQTLAQCQQVTPLVDYATEVTPQVVADYLDRAGFTDHEERAPNVLLVPIQGTHTRFDVAIQLFEQEDILFMATNGYMEIEQARSSQAMVLLLTQLAALNYELLLGKFQLNPRSGEISLSVELNLDDGLGFKTFDSTFKHLVRVADERYPELLDVARGDGL